MDENPVLICIYLYKGQFRKMPSESVTITWVQLLEICRKATWCNPDKCSCNGDQIEIVTGELGGSPRKTLTALSVSVNWSTESFLFVHPERNPSGSWQYFPLALTIKYNFHCNYIENDTKCSRFHPRIRPIRAVSGLYLSKSNLPSPVSSGQIVGPDRHLNSDI